MATTLAAQNDFDLDKATSGRLGQTFTLQVNGAPANQIILFFLSFNAGPTPLFLLDGVDTRSMQVGVDLLDLMAFALTSPTGAASYNLATPDDPTWYGLAPLHYQAAMLPFAGPTFFGEISNDIVMQFGAPDTAVTSPSTLLAPRAFGVAFRDTDNNAGGGDVVIAGGGAGTLTSATGTATTEVWDYRHMQVVPGPTMSTSRTLHAAVTLTDGRVLVIGGVNTNSIIQNTCEIYNPATNTFTPTGSMATARMMHAACRLADGRVMVAGGASALDLANLTVTALSSVEIWNPATGTWSAGAAIGGARIAPALTLLPNNQVMVSGGVQVSYFGSIPIAANSTNAVQRWTPPPTPGPGSWTAGPNMPIETAFHHGTTVTLADGRVLVTGGIDVVSLLSVQNAAPIQGAAVYNPTLNSWTSTPMPVARALHTATRLADGRVVLCGGAQGTLTVPTSIQNVDVFLPGSLTWSTAPALLTPRAGHVAALTPDGTLVLFGGQDTVGTTASIDTLRF
ncbi:MAG: hypothetical protein JNL08_14910 [Planctomycetes bacterium]|nr:hypothetical protein [Planctomycetota bacterium]